MILLTSISDLVELVTGGSQIVHVHAAYVDVSSGTATPGRLNSVINSASTNNIVASPASSTQRNVKFISIANTDASASVAITVKHTDGSNLGTLINMTLLAGYSMTYNDLDGWVLLDASGGRVETPLAGRFLKSTVLTTGTTFTTGPSTNTIKIRMVGGGGGGAGCTTVASAASYGGGGGSGGYLEKTVAVTPNTAYTYAIGAAGSNASGAAGGNGTNSTFTVGANTYTANGGTGAVLATATATAGTCYAGGAGGVVSTNGDLNSAGSPGGNGVMTVVATPLGVSGEGGSSPFGGGGKPITAVGAGSAAAGFGAGGGGAATGASAARAGGAPTAGCIVVDEYS